MKHLIVGVAALVLAGCSDTPEPAPAPPSPKGWTPGKVLASPQVATRGWIDVRGIIHAHSVYSHDACDGMPREGADELGAINQPCFDDFREALCAVAHDFVMLTDHSTSFSDTEFPEVLLYREERGDQLLERNGGPVANLAGCDGAANTMVLAGTETNFMPVGLEGHVAEDIAERKAIYSADTPQAIEQLQSQGAVVLLQHTEDWTAEQLSDLGADGFEMYNLHANAIVGAGGAASLLAKQSTPELLPHPDLVLLPIVNEDKRYLERWGTVLAGGARSVTTMGTDVHQNTFAQELPDGERIDSYRRMMQWFSNHLLLDESKADSWSDSDLKDALRSGRLYGSFDVFGYPGGFDFHADAAGALVEMGQEASLASGVELVVERPYVRDLDPDGVQPEISLVVLRAKENGWDVVTQSSESLTAAISETGAYRVEVRIRPRHLAPYLSSYVELAEQDFVWIYSNAIHVVP